jgi:hypothetical protein
MATGHLDDTWERALAADATEPVRGFLGLPPEQAPGSVFAYNPSATYTLATILQRDTGQSLTDYLRPRLLDPLGIGAVGWQQHPPGRDVGFTGLHASTDAIARLGQLYLQRGTWQGRRLLPEAWVEEATRAHVANPGGPEPDWQQGYGYQFWRSRHGYRGDGAYGQFCLVLPDHDLVVATTAGTERMQAVLDAVWQHLLPAVDRPSAPADEAALTERLAHLSLPAYDGPAAAPPQERQVLVPAGGTCEAQPSLVAVEVAPDGDGSRLVLVEDDDARIAARVAPGGWSVCDDGPVPVAATGRSAGDGLDVDVLFLETPHRLTVTTDPAAGTFRARWRTTPLGGPRLGRLHSPSPV